MCGEFLVLSIFPLINFSFTADWLSWLIWHFKETFNIIRICIIIIIAKINIKQWIEVITTNKWRIKKYFSTIKWWAYYIINIFFLCNPFFGEDYVWIPNICKFTEVYFSLISREHFTTLCVFSLGFIIHYHARKWEHYTSSLPIQKKKNSGKSLVTTIFISFYSNVHF